MLDIQVFHKMVFTGGEDQKKYFIFTCLINELNRQELYIQEIDRQLAKLNDDIEDNKQYYNQLNDGLLEVISNLKAETKDLKKALGFRVLVGLAVIGLIVIGVLVWGMKVI